MKLASKAYLLTLLILTLVFVAPAQQRSERDDRNTAPTVGTGGPFGGPTGLFTVYDGQTLRRGEYTLSGAWSNYDRDPGNVDITSVPLSFQVGLTNNFELFFGTEAYRGVKVNSPRNLSSFYLPNSRIRLPDGTFAAAPAIVLAPGTGGTLANQAVFRPTGAPFAAFPFVGANAGTFGVPAPFFAGPFFGFAAGTNPTLGPIRAGGAVDLFPGVGSPFGSILPGFVLTTQTLLSPTGAPRGEGPLSFSAVPSYLPDAPFINRRWGQSAFNTLEAGFKWRFNDVTDGWGHGLVFGYRWYLDQADGSGGGFNMMQRGSGSGSNWGDVGLTYFIDARVAPWANVSANIGYLYTTKIKGTFGGREATILDPGDQLQYGIGLDFPVNRYFQPILELRGLHYVGGRTPNALENDPVDGIAGVRIYPRRWFGFGFAYRHHFNEQDRDSFSESTSVSSVTTICGPLSAPGCTPATVNFTQTGIPAGLVPSSDPHGYIFQFWVGRRDRRAGPVLNQPANVESVTLSDTDIVLPCPPNTSSRSGACGDNRTVSVTTVARDPENDVLTYNYTVSGGRVVGTGANVQWDLSGVQAGTYTITTGVDDGCGVCGRTDTRTVTVRACPDCEAPRVECSCPTVTVSGPAGVTQPGGTMTFTANVSGGTVSGAWTYNWTVSAGTITSGQGTPSITVSTTADDAGRNVTASVTVTENDPNCDCNLSGSETAGIASPPRAEEQDTFGAATPDDIKARVDNFFIALNNRPGSQGYIIIYGTPAEIRRRRAQITSAINFRKYPMSQVTFIEGGNRGAGVETRFVIVPPGATPPTP